MQVKISQYHIPLESSFQLGSLSLSHPINQWKLNKVPLTSKIETPVGTFKNKLSERQTAYKETEQLKEVLMQVSADIQDLCGLSFNEALKKVAKK